MKAITSRLCRSGKPSNQLLRAQVFRTCETQIIVGSGDGSPVTTNIGVTFGGYAYPHFLEWGVPYPHFSGAWQKNTSDCP